MDDHTYRIHDPFDAPVRRSSMLWRRLKLFLARLLVVLARESCP
jgi:hypothetical protein